LPSRPLFSSANYEENSNEQILAPKNRFSVVFFPRFVPEKHRHARFLRFKMARGAHDGGAFGMGIGRRQKKLHSFTPKAEEFLKKVHDFVAKMPLFWGTVGLQMARGALFGVFCAQS
jgi:hypothetical protein